MKILCLHGMGTSGQIFQAQLARVLYKLKKQGHEFVFIDGQIEVEGTSDVKSIYPAPYLAYYNVPYAHLVSNARLHILDEIISKSGPFDGVMGFSQGAALAASMILEHARSKADPASEPLFKFGVFIGATLPFNRDDLSGWTSYADARAGHEKYKGEFAGEIGKAKPLGFPEREPPSAAEYADATPSDDGSSTASRAATTVGDDDNPILLGRYHPGKTPDAVLPIPTIHVIGKQDSYAPQARLLAELCQENGRVVIEHMDGHRAPRDPKVNEKLISSIQQVMGMVE